MDESRADGVLAVVESGKSEPDTSFAATGDNDRIPAEVRKQWMFLTNHAHVLAQLYGNPDLLLREVAVNVGITERAVRRIVQDLEQSGFIERERHGRRNHYRVYSEGQPGHPNESHCRVSDLLTVIAERRRQR